MAQEWLIVRGARQHNLKNIHVKIPRDKLVVITGISGSGKSSLAFDTIYAEGQRRYVESLSAYARQFLEMMDKPDVDAIDGLSPAISIDQRGVSRNPRSTVGTVTEIYDYLRLLFARVGVPHCPRCGQRIAQQTVQQIVDAIMAFPEGTRLLVLAPLVKDRKGEHRAVLEDIRKAGYVRVRVNGEVRDVEEDIQLDRYKSHTIEAVVDRLIVRHAEDPQDREDDLARLTDSVETALNLGGGVVLVSDVTGDKPRDHLYSEHFACVRCGISLPEIEPRTFSFNSPHGACPACGGLGTQLELDPDLIIPDKDLSLAEGAIKPWSRDRNGDSYYNQLLRAVARQKGIPMNVPVRELSQRQLHVVLYGAPPGETVRVEYHNYQGLKRAFDTHYEGVIPNLQRRYQETKSDYIRAEIERYMTIRPCPVCQGRRLKPEALAVTVGGLSIDQVTAMSAVQALRWIEELERASEEGGHDPDDERYLSPRQLAIARPIFKELKARLQFMADVGLDYLTLDRRAATLSGGEAQRIRLATQIGSRLMGVLYILDEPSIGLHQRDNARLIQTLKG
ncbi:MAG: excinuclease ABC subunit UvrA, partial [Anaerolineae bacterium]|nr:excinuclease ABC subunit UvrA [Anaerolineae bacterium]